MARGVIPRFLEFISYQQLKNRDIGTLRLLANNLCNDQNKKCWRKKVVAKRILEELENEGKRTG